MQVAILSGRSILKNPQVRVAWPGIRNDVKVFQQRFAIGGDVEKPARLPSAGYICLPVDHLCKMQAQFMTPRLQRNVIRECAFAPVLIQLRIACAEYGVRRVGNGSPSVEVSVRPPNLPETIGERLCGSSQDPNGLRPKA